VLDRGVAYARAPYFYSDQWDMNMEYVGHPSRWDRLVFRGALGSGSFCAFWLDGGRVVAGLNARLPDASPTIAKLVESRATPDVARLTDPAVPLAELLPPAS
jgi:3-phenylpropionate/trans-cinnamate dioxygenase ferredoxin reductase subunit